MFRLKIRQLINQRVSLIRVLSCLSPIDPLNPNTQECGGDASLHPRCQDLPLAQVPGIGRGSPPTVGWAGVIYEAVPLPWRSSWQLKQITP